MFFYGFLEALISVWFDYAISKIFDFDDKPLLGFLCGFFLVFLIILRLLVLILVLYIIGKCMMFYYAGVGILFIPSTKYFRPIFYYRIGFIFLFVYGIYAGFRGNYDIIAQLIENIKSLISLLQ